jgi:hypothetical protein
MYPRLIYILSFSLLLSCSQQVPNQQRQLALDWQFSGLGADTWLPAQVPGSVQEDLQRNDLSLDPFFGINEDYLTVTVLNDGEVEVPASLIIELVKTNGKRVWQLSKDFVLPPNRPLLVY